MFPTSQRPVPPNLIGCAMPTPPPLPCALPSLTQDCPPSRTSRITFTGPFHWLSSTPLFSGQHSTVPFFKWKRKTLKNKNVFKKCLMIKSVLYRVGNFKISGNDEGRFRCLCQVNSYVNLNCILCPLFPLCLYLVIRVFSFPLPPIPFF